MFLNLLPMVLGTAALLMSHAAQSTECRNEIGFAASNGLGASDPGGFGSVYYQRAFGNGTFVGGAFGVGDVLPGRTSVRVSARAGYRFSTPGDDKDLWPQASIEMAFPMIMGDDSGRGRYLNLGFGALIQSQFSFSIELQLGTAKHTGAAFASPATGPVKTLRAGLGYRF